MRNESYSEWNPYRDSKFIDILNKFQGDPRGPKGAFEGMGPWGHLGLFRSHFESKAISNGRLLRMGRHSEERANLKFARETTNCKNSYCKATYNGSENCGPKRIIS